MSKHDLYASVTDKIVQALESGAAPWSAQWRKTGAHNDMPIRFNGKPYRGINVILLWIAAMEAGYASNRWLTYRQAAELGGQVRKGQSGSSIVFTSTFNKSKGNENTASGDDSADAGDVEGASGSSQRMIFMRGYTVFNVDQIDGLPASYYAEQPQAVVDFEDADAFLNSTGAVIHHRGNAAHYLPSLDLIELPLPQQFVNQQAYLGIKSHELVHWTGAKHRLGRDFSGRFGSEAYAFEELVAELGAAFLCAELGISAEPREDHAAYLQSWLKVLKGDRRAIFRAAACAQKAVDFINDQVYPRSDDVNTDVEPIDADEAQGACVATAMTAPQLLAA